MKQILFLGTDTLHRRYMINRMRTEGFEFDEIILERESVKPTFHTGPFLDEEQCAFEQKHFFERVSSDISKENLKSVATLNDSESIDVIRAHNPDFGIVSGACKLSPEVINQFKDGLINVHLGIAEDYRGLDSNLWAAYHGDYDHMGVTIHWVDTQLDTGDIIFQEKVNLPVHTKIYQLRYYTTLLAVELVLNALRDYTTTGISSRTQTKRGRYYSFMPLCLKEQVEKKFEKKFSSL